MKAKWKRWIIEHVALWIILSVYTIITAFSLLLGFLFIGVMFR